MNQAEAAQIVEAIEVAIGDFVNDTEDDLEDDDRELAAVVRMLRADSSNAWLCGREDESRYIDGLVERLERLEHRD